MASVRRFRDVHCTSSFSNGDVLAFYYGSKLITQGRADSGEVINVFMSIMTGAFSLAMLTSEMECEITLS